MACGCPRNGETEVTLFLRCWLVINRGQITNIRITSIKLETDTCVSLSTWFIDNSIFESLTLQFYFCLQKQNDVFVNTEDSSTKTAAGEI